MIPDELAPILRTRGHVHFYNYLIDRLGSARDAQQYGEIIALFREREVLEYLARNRRGLSPLANAILEGLCDNVLSGDGVRLSMDYLALPPLFAWLEWRTSRSGDLEAIRAPVRERLAATAGDGRARFRIVMLLLLLDGFLDGPEAALRQLIDRVTQAYTWMPTEIGSKLQLLGWYDERYSGLGRHALARVQDVTRPEPDAIDISLGVLEALGYSKLASRRWNALVHEEFVLPLMNSAFTSGAHNLALHLEQRVFRAYLPQTETNDHFRTCTRGWLAGMAAAGRTRRTTQPLRIRPDHGEAPVRIAFLLFGANTLAHMEGLLTLLHGAAQLKTPLFEPVVYVFVGVDEQLRRQVRAAGVPLVFLDERVSVPRSDWVARLEWLRTDLRTREVTALAYVSNPVTMLYAFGMRVAPVQIWWAMKYHELESADIDGYMTGGSIEERRRRIGNRDWHTAPGSIANLSSAESLARAAVLRRAFGDDVALLGSIVRPEKLHDEAFLGALARILHAAPQARYLWFGQVQPPALVQRLRELGIAEQCLFQGWVDTRLYAGVLDVHLDPFPFPAGITMLQTMAAGVPGVTLLTAESRQNGIMGMLGGLLDGAVGSPALQRRVREAVTDADGSRLLFFAQSIEEYIAFAGRLVADPDLRDRAGQAAVRLLRCVNDPVRTAEMFGHNLREIVAEAEQTQAAGVAPAVPGVRAGARSG